MWRAIAPRIPFVVTPLVIGAGLITLIALVGGKAETARRAVSGPQAGAAGADGLTDLTVENQQNLRTIFDQLSNSVVEKTKNHVQPARAAVETTARTLGLHTSLVDDPILERYCIDVLNQYRQIDNFYIADMKGSRIMASRMGEAVEIDIIDRRGRQAIYIKKRGQRVLSRQTEEERIAAFAGDRSKAVYDPRVRPWFLKAKKEKTLCWSDVYIFATGSGDQQPGFTVSCPTLDDSASLLFVTAADFVVENFSGFLRELPLGKHGIAFLMNGKEELIGYPEASRVIERKGREVSLAKAASVLPDWGRKALEISRQSEPGVFLFDSADKRYIGSFAPFLPSSGNGWRIGVIVPEEDLARLGEERG